MACLTRQNIAKSSGRVKLIIAQVSQYKMFHVEHFALRTDVPRGTVSQSLRLTGLPLQAAHANFFPQIFSSTRIGTCSGATSASAGIMNVCCRCRPATSPSAEFELRHLFRFGSHR